MLEDPPYINVQVSGNQVAHFDAPTQANVGARVIGGSSVCGFCLLYHLRKSLGRFCLSLGLGFEGLLDSDWLLY